MVDSMAALRAAPKVALWVEWTAAQLGDSTADPKAWSWAAATADLLAVNLASRWVDPRVGRWVDVKAEKSANLKAAPKVDWKAEKKA